VYGGCHAFPQSVPSSVTPPRARFRYCRATARCQAVWSTQRRRAFFGLDGGSSATDACVSAAGHVGWLRDGLAVVVDIETERQRSLAAERAATLRSLCEGTEMRVNEMSEAVARLRARAEAYLAELLDLAEELESCYATCAGAACAGG
jgi:hypothetical protein